MLLGFHLSTRGGYRGAYEDAAASGCRSAQIFLRRAETLPSESFFPPGGPAPVESLLVHLRFAPGLGSSLGPWRRRAVKKLSSELKGAQALGASGFVLHLGAFSPGSDSRAGLKLAAESAIAAVEEAGARLPLLLENVPGGGRRMGGSLEEIETWLSAVSRRVPGCGLCLDTAHALAAGHPVESAEGMSRFIARARELLGAPRIMAFHLNDTRSEPGSGRDHHELLGKGRIAIAAFKLLISDPGFAETPGILEVAGPLEVRKRALDEALALAR